MAKLTNREIEEKAIEFIKSQCKNVKSGTTGYDLKIGNKIVEVKGTASNKAWQNIYMSRKPEYDAWKTNPQKYWIYRVINVGKKDCKIIPIPAKYLMPKRDPRWRVKVNKKFYKKSL